MNARTFMPSITFRMFCLPWLYDTAFVLQKITLTLWRMMTDIWKTFQHGIQNNEFLNGKSRLAIELNFLTKMSSVDLIKFCSADW
jgi:hypothetical protein